MNKISTLLVSLVALFMQIPAQAQSDADVYKVTPILTENFATLSMVPRTSPTPSTWR